MAVIVMIIGASGSGKSTSLRNFAADDAFVVNVNGKPLPFRNTGIKVWKSTNYESITKALRDAPTPSIVVDDATYLMTGEFIRTSTIKGYDKFTDMAVHFVNLVNTAAGLPDNKIVYFLGHIATDDKTGDEKFKTIGKMIDEKVGLEGYFTIVLKTVVEDGKYYFQTQTNGHDTCKSPMGMFDSLLIDNDLKLVDKTIREYYNI